MIRATIQFANQNSPAITATSTVALVIVTGVYVWLVNKQVQHLIEQKQEVRRHDARVLRAICRRLRYCLEQLPKRIEHEGEDNVLHAVIWDGDDLHELELRAAVVGEPESEDAMHIVNSLRRIEDVIHQCKRRQENPNAARLSGLQKSDWQRVLPDTTARLTRLIERAELVAKETRDA